MVLSRYLRVLGLVSVLTIVMVFSYGVSSVTAQVSPQYVVVDDYAGVSLPGRSWYYSSIGTDRGEMGSGSYSVTLGGGQAQVSVASGWAGVWTSLMHNAVDQDVLKPTQLLGPYVKAQFQPRITGIEIGLAEGNGTFRVELQDVNNAIVYNSGNITLPGGPYTISLSVAPTVDLKFLNWLIDDAGSATVKQVRFKIESPSYSIPEAVFLFSYGHLSQCYDAASGMVRDRAHWPVRDFAAVPCVGTFALATVLAQNLGYVDAVTTQVIVQKTKEALLMLAQNHQTQHGVLPHFVSNKDDTGFKIVENTEWSSVDTVIGLTAAILANQAMVEDTSQLENLLNNIDWNDLTNNGAQSIGHGYSYVGAKLATTWDTFGSEAFLVAVAYAAAQGRIARLDKYRHPPTWDGSGFNDELAALFFSMQSKDAWGNDWAKYRQDAYEKQINYFSQHIYSSLGLFGLSACEVPEPWMVAENQVYQAFGVGGHNNQPNDGTDLVGYPVIAPHYAAMVGTEHPATFQQLFNYLISTKEIFTPLNNVESLGLDNTETLHWNCLKGSWNLSLQCLGAARALSGSDYLPYRALENNDFLKQGFQRVQYRSPTWNLLLLLLD
jgi:hypothetical protein